MTNVIVILLFAFLYVVPISLLDSSDIDDKKWGCYIFLIVTIILIYCLFK